MAITQTTFHRKFVRTSTALTHNRWRLGVYLLVALTTLPELQLLGNANLPNLANMWGLALLGLLIITDLFIWQRTAIKIKPILALLPFLTITTVTLLYAQDFSYSITQYSKLLIQVMTYVVLLPALLRSASIIKGSLFVMMIVGIIFSIYGLYAKRVLGLAYVPSHAWMGLDISATGISSYLAVVTPIAVCWLLVAKGRARWLAAAVSGLLIYTLIATLTRSSLFSLVVSLIPVLWLKYGKRLTLNRLLLFLLLFLLLVAIGMIFYNSVILTSRSQIIVSSGRNSIDSSNFERNTLWYIAVNAFLDNPLIGTGFGNFRSYSSQYQFLAYNYDAHGLSQKLIAETGILGFVSFYAFLLLVGTKVWQVMRRLPEQQWPVNAILAAFCSSFIHNQFGTRYFFPLFWLVVGLAITIGWRRSLFHENSDFYH